MGVEGWRGKLILWWISGTVVWRRGEQSTWLYSWRRVQEGGVVEGVVGGGEGTKAPHTPLPFSTCILSPHHYIQVTRVAILLYGQAERGVEER